LAGFLAGGRERLCFRRRAGWSSGSVRRRDGEQAGAGFVMVTWLGPGDADRLALAVQFGADLAVDVAVEDLVADHKGELLAWRMSSST
jgi:hypothetical protein